MQLGWDLQLRRAVSWSIIVSQDITVGVGGRVFELCLVTLSVRARLVHIISYSRRQHSSKLPNVLDKSSSHFLSRFELRPSGTACLSVLLHVERFESHDVA